MKNNKGFATSLIIFGLLILFLGVVSVLLATTNNSYILNNTLREDLLSNIEQNKAKIYANNLYYDNSETNLNCSDVQCALEKINEMIK